MRRVRTWLRLVGTFLTSALCTGCGFGMLPYTPIPVPPWVTERLQQKYCNQNDYKTPIMPPIAPGNPPRCEDPPDKATVLRAMPRVARGVPYCYEEYRDDIDVVVEPLVDHIDPPRFYPLVGPAQLHHCHYRCTIYYTETVQSDYPFPFLCKRRRTEVVYIDRDHLHTVACTPETQQSMTQDIGGFAP